MAPTKKLGWLRSSVSSGVITAACGSTALFLGLGLCGSGTALAQHVPGEGPQISIHSGVPGATPWLEPAPSSPVPSWAEQSYKVYLQMKAKAHGGTVYTRKTYDKMPNWTGYWTIDGGGLTWDQMAISKEAHGLGPKVAQDILHHCWRGNTPEFPCKGWQLAPLTPQYALMFREKLTAVAHGVEWDPLSDCLPPGFPRTMIDPFGKEFIDTPKETWITAQTLNDIRRIYTDGRGHLPPDVAHQMWDGDSIGFWDGDTLVVHTLYMRPAELQRLQPSISDEASVLEIIKMTGPNTLVDKATIYDPLALRRPWTGVIKYVRETTPDVRMDMYACDPNVYQDKNGNTALLIPGESVTITKHYRDPTADQNIGLKKVRAYGAKILRSMGELPPGPPSSAASGRQ